MAENEYINRRGLRAKAFGKDHPIFFDGEDRADWYEKCINEMPAIDVAPVRHGYWICENLGFGAYRYRCSECGNIYGQDQIEDFEHNKFCGDCGAKMAEIK